MVAAVMLLLSLGVCAIFIMIKARRALEIQGLRALYIVEFYCPLRMKRSVFGESGTLQLEVLRTPHVLSLERCRETAGPRLSR